MFRSKSVKKKDVRSKSNERVSVSEPYNVRHDIHTEETDLYESNEDPVSPLVPCPEISDNNVHSTVSDVSFSQLMKEEIIPAFRSEMVKIIDEKLTIIDDRLCQRCFHTTLQDERGPNLNNWNLYTSSTETVSLDVPEIEQQNTSLKVKNEADIKTSETERNSLESFSYLVDHEKEQHYSSSTHTKQSSRHEKYRSKIQGQDETQPKSAESLPENMPPRLIKTEKHKYIGRPLSKLDERECLANALQWHIEELVDGIVFKDSELPDDLLADGCLTEDECADVRKQIDRKDQVRFLLSIIKGRDFDVLKRFLKHLRSHNPTVAKSIDETFKRNKIRGMKSSKCALCKLFQVNIEYVVDILWKNNLIDDGLYNLIVRTDKPNGAPSYLWNCVIESLNKCCDKDSSHVRRIIGNALTKKHHYHHIAQGIEWMINTDRALRCRCSLRHYYVNTFSSLGSLVSSRSPKSSESELRRYSQSDLSLSTTAGIGSFEEAQRGSTSQPYEVKAHEEMQNCLISTTEAVSAETHASQKTPTDTTHEDTVDNGQETQNVLTCKTGKDNTDTKYLAKQKSLTTTESHGDNCLGNVHGTQNSILKSTNEQEESIKTKYTAEQNQSLPVKGSVIANMQVKTSKTDQENIETNYFVKREPHTGTTHENNVHGNDQETQNDLTSESELESTEVKCHEKKKSLTSAKQDNIDDENEQETQNGITSKTEQDNTKIECFEKQKPESTKNREEMSVENMIETQSGLTSNTEQINTEKKQPYTRKPPTPIERLTVKQLVSMYNKI